MMQGPKKTNFYSAGLNASEMREAAFLRYVQSPLCN
jgi:hypothetical protein